MCSWGPCSAAPLFMQHEYLECIAVNALLHSPVITVSLPESEQNCIYNPIFMTVQPSSTMRHRLQVIQLAVRYAWLLLNH
jgi:hypothetical protein